MRGFEPSWWFFVLGKCRAGASIPRLSLGFRVYFAYVWQIVGFDGIYLAYVWHSLGGNLPLSVEIATAKIRIPANGCHT